MPVGRGRLWSGSLSFGLVSAPVALTPAVRPRKTRFHLIHRPDGSRLRRRMYCPDDDVFVPTEHIQRGYEVEPGQHIIVRDEEIEALAPRRSRTIEIQQFVDRAALGPASFDRPYWLVPTGAEKPYALLVEVLAAMDRIGLAQFVMLARERFAAVQSIDGALSLVLLRYPQQVRSHPIESPPAEANDADVEAVAGAIERISGPFEPERLEDLYEQRVERLIARKRQAGEVIQGPQPQDESDASAPTPKRDQGTGGESFDLVAALEESLARETEMAR